MAGKEKTVNYVIRAVKPVPFILALFQMSAKIIVGFISIIAGLFVASYMLFGVGGGYGDGLVVPDGDGAIKKVNTITIGGNPGSKNKLLVLDLSGMILGSPPFPAQDSFLYALYGVTFGHQLEAQILSAAEDDSIKGIFLQTSTPGGTIHGSEAINSAIKKYQEKTGRPVVVWIEGMSASGGVYSTASASAIYAAPGSYIGSIGVTAGSMMYYDDPIAIDGGVTTRGGIKVETLTAGEGKDFGNPFRPMSDRERELSHEGLENSYANFVRFVSEGRGIDPDVIVNTMGAHIFGNKQAEEFGLIDATLNLGDAIGALAFLAKLPKDDYVIVRRFPKGSRAFESLVQNSSIESKLHGDPEMAAMPPGLKAQVCNASFGAPLVYQGSLGDLCE